MGLADIDRTAILAAVEEFDRIGRDAFLERYGFADAREFWLVIDGRRYDSKAIVGVAHGYVPGHDRLTAEDFSGGAATVQPLLESLGFEVLVERERRYDWTRDEVVLALDLYVKAGALNGGGLPGSGTEGVRGLSKVLNRLAIHPVEGRGPKFRNPDGVALKLANLRSAERDAALRMGAPGAGSLPRGSSNRSKVDLAVIEEFWDRWDALAREAERIRRAAEAELPPGHDTGVEVVTVPVEATETESFYAGGGSGGTRTRSESLLRDAYVEYMRGLGHRVAARSYRIAGEARRLRCDVFVEDLELLVEAKASDDRGAIRYAIGQLLDYALRHNPRPALAVLVPYKPRSDLLRLLDSIEIGCAWQRAHGGFSDNRGGRMTA